MFKTLLGDKVILEKPVEEKKKDMEKTQSGLFIPPSEEDTSGPTKRTKVVQAGIDCKHIVDGDEIIFDVRMVQPLKVDGVEYLVTREESIVGIL